jgi:uncharacterized membrane protein
MKHRNLLAQIKKNFLSGIIFLFPFVFTSVIIIFLVNKVTGPFNIIIDKVFASHLSNPLTFIFSKLLILALLYLCISFIGFLGSRFFTYLFFHMIDNVFKNLPIINRLYLPLKQVVQFLLGADIPEPTSIVLVPFPHDTSSSIGLLVKEKLEGLEERQAVLLLGTPNPLMGFLLFYKKKHLKTLDITLKEALEIVITCGAISDPRFLQERSLKSLDKSIVEKATEELL